jgi:hypothetical protein
MYNNTIRFLAIGTSLLIISGMTNFVCFAQTVDLTDRLILHLPFDGNAMDQSEKNFLTQISGPVLTSDRNGNTNSAYIFDGIDDHIKINNDNPIIIEYAFTISLWAKVLGPSSTLRRSNSFFEQRDDNALQASSLSTIHFVLRDDNSLALQLRTSPTPDGNVDMVEEYCVSDQEWHHYLAKLDENSIASIYFDGVLLNSMTIEETGNFITSVDHIDIGLHMYNNEIKSALNGILDDVYIFNRAINECEIQMLYLGSVPDER